jgi:formyl-CoA transferase
MLAEWASEYSVAEFVERFAELGIPAAAVRTYAEAARDPHVAARDMLQPTASAGARTPLVGPAAKLSRTPSRVRSAAPELGEHNREVLAELGYDPNEIQGLEQPTPPDLPELDRRSGPGS